MNLSRRKILIIVLILTTLDIFWRNNDSEEIVEVNIKQPLSVTVATVSKSQKFNGLWMTGTIEGLTSAIISSKYSDAVFAVYVENGQQVNAGDKLLSIDSTELENNLHLAESDVKKSKVNNENLFVNYQRKKQLFEIGAISKEILESAEVQWRTSVAEVDDVETKMQIAEKKLADATILSPVNGVVANKNVTIGQVVSAGTQLTSYSHDFGSSTYRNRKLVSNEC